MNVVSGPKSAAALLAPVATCILISHDRSFVEAAGTRFLVIKGRRVREVPDATCITGR